ncbi:uncharacterized protein LOC118438331 [Folsomia candida]|uniref:uncharacterized protein LOC118438331 n=1 Tax=Folsomia candida TaxID=158441 RepID=UPI001605416C|nr:uncharacterized protein LOC118438331 [Folsomia candida]
MFTLGKVTKLRMNGNTDKPTKTKKTSVKLSLRKTIFMPPMFVVYMAPALVVFALIANLDPLYFLFYWFSYHGLSFPVRFGIRLVSFVTLVMSAISAGQVLLGCGYVFVMAAWTLLRCMRLIDEDYKVRTKLLFASPKELSVFVILYNRVILILAGVAAPQASVTLFMLVGCALVIIVLNIMSVNMHDQLPLNIYLMGPFFSVVLIIILNTVLKFVSYYEHISENMLRLWKNDPILVVWGVHKVHGRRVAAMRPIRVFMGIWTTNLLPVNAQFLCHYDAFIADSTVLLTLNN